MADWLRRAPKFSMAGGLALGLVVLSFVFTTTRLEDVTSALRGNVQNQVRNRARNVATWCGAINASRDYDRAFIRRVTRGHLTYTLSDLDCRALEAKTLASTKK